MIEQVTPLIITYDEAPNIGRTLAKLFWARRIVVIDSGSTDGTLDLLRSHAQVEVLHRSFDDFASQCNFGLEQITTPWVLSLDADYELSEGLVTELHNLAPAASTAGYRARFIYRIHGKALRGTLYPPRVVLYRREVARYGNEGHGHRVITVGETLPLAAPIYHDDRKPLSRWFASQQIYAAKEAEHLLSARSADLRLADRIRRAGWPAPFLVFVYTLLIKRCLLDGWSGWFYALQRLLAETMIALALLERRLRGGAPERDACHETAAPKLTSARRDWRGPAQSKLQQKKAASAGGRQ